jgi:hypothetical protein
MRLAIAVALAFLPQVSHAAEVTAAALRAAMAGTWQGALGYRDYESNKLFELPVRTVIVQEADGVTQVRRSRFDEGPGQAPVWITTVSMDDAKAATVSSATFRKGRAVELFTEKAELTRYTGPADWTIRYSRTGQDGGSESDIRITETRSGNTVTAVKEVKPVGAPDSAFAFRNQQRLTLESATPPQH